MKIHKVSQYNTKINVRILYNTNTATTQSEEVRLHTSSIVIVRYSNFGNTYLSKEFARVLGRGQIVTSLEHLAQCRGGSSLAPGTVPRCSSDVTMWSGPNTRAAILTNTSRQNSVWTKI